MGSRLLLDGMGRYFGKRKSRDLGKKFALLRLADYHEMWCRTLFVGEHGLGTELYLQ